jgi:hypothetical protein
LRTKQSGTFEEFLPEGTRDTQKTRPACDAHLGAWPPSHLPALDCIYDATHFTKRSFGHRQCYRANGAGCKRDRRAAPLATAPPGGTQTKSCMQEFAAALSGQNLANFAPLVDSEARPQAVSVGQQAAISRLCPIQDAYNFWALLEERLAKDRSSPVTDSGASAPG